VILAISPTSKKIKLCGTGSSADASEAIKCSPKPIPITSGLPFLVATSVSGLSISITPSA